MLRRIGEEIAHRWISRDPWPLGADAPPHSEIDTDVTRLLDRYAFGAAAQLVDA